MNSLIGKFYDLSYILNDDYELIADFLIKFTSTKYKRGHIMRYIENANYSKIEDEILEALEKKDLAYTFSFKNNQQNLFAFMEETI